jgi:uncharacterized membrane protein (UPF0127 family)
MAQIRADAAALLRSCLTGLIILLAAAAAAQALTFEQGELEIEKADGTRHAFIVELAQSPQQWTQGLMYRQSLAPDAGMLFLYQRERSISMWMKNTYIPLDMLFIDKNGVIVDIAERTVPHSTAIVSPAVPASAVLEVNGGTVARLGLSRGDRVIYPAFAAP